MGGSTRGVEKMKEQERWKRGEERQCQSGGSGWKA